MMNEKPNEIRAKPLLNISEVKETRNLVKNSRFPAVK
jgi:hypothetical protein